MRQYTSECASPKSPGIPQHLTLRHAESAEYPQPLTIRHARTLHWCRTITIALYCHDINGRHYICLRKASFISDLRVLTDTRTSTVSEY